MNLDAVEATISAVQVTTVFTVAKVAVGAVIIPRLPPVIRYKGIYVHFSSIGILAGRKASGPVPGTVIIIVKFVEIKLVLSACRLTQAT